MSAVVARLGNLSNNNSVWRFNHFLRVTYVAPAWLVVWDHRHQPPQRFDFNEPGNPQAVRSMAAHKLQTLAAETRD